ncbi:Zn-ribbon domain-containing OB-fold protein [Aquihabitans sp. G128]|uniref:Zn-ribbon domain-containing OB-fold protein n=1 Tax=Aquihabitans sp. G128 TaxID=2849779 RepID=UPI0020B3C599|nr:OB-fold domain-containing protein [Aquihabitans sp. G128]
MPSGESTFTMELLYRRSLGPVVGAFLTALREQRLLGSRTAEGRVICPPLEYDPDSGDAVDDLVEVGSAGVVTGWSWVAEPRAKHPLPHPFAWALVQLDGADTSMVHALDAGSLDAVRTGMRVQVRWAPERTGHITDIACFEPEAS